MKDFTNKIISNYMKYFAIFMLLIVINSCGEDPVAIKIDTIDIYKFADTNLVGTISPLHFYRTNLNYYYSDIDKRVTDYEKYFKEIDATLQINDKNINNFYTIKVGTRIDNYYTFQNEFLVNGKTYNYNLKFYLKDPLLADKSILMLTSDFKSDSLSDYYKNIEYTLTLIY